MLRSISILVVLVSASVAHAEAPLLRAADGTEIFGEFRAAKKGNNKVVLLFHQAGSNHHEYDPIAPALNKIGWDTVAIDQRSGGKLWGKPNMTVKKRGKSTNYLSALADLDAAVDWSQDNQYKTVVAVGSSYSAALVFLLATKWKGSLTAIASFSPGEYLGKPKLVHSAAAKLNIPLYVTAATSKKEQKAIDAVLAGKKSKSAVTRHKPKHGVHGASTMRADRNPKQHKANLQHFLAFLAGLVPQ